MIAGGGLLYDRSTVVPIAGMLQGRRNFMGTAGRAGENYTALLREVVNPSVEEC